MVAQHGKVIYQSAIGYANGQKTKELSPELLFDIGSIYKEFNSIAIMWLGERGKLKLDDKITQYLPNLPAWASDIQIAHLLQYTSGLPQFYASADSTYWNALLQLKHLEFTPGSAYIYSNSNVFLQMKIIERITGMSYESFVEKNILLPLKIKGRFMELPSSDPAIARPFDNTYTETVYKEKTTSLLLSANDLYLWCKALHSYQVIGKPSVDQLSKRFGNNEGSLGEVKFKGDAINEHTHQGSGDNYECLMYDNLPQDLIIILMTNNQNFKVNQVKDAIVAILDNEPYTIPKKSIYIDLRTRVLDNFNEGIAFYRQIKSTQPNQYDFSSEAIDLCNTGKFLMRRNRFDDAIRIFELSTLVDLKNTGSLSYAYYLIGDCYVKKGEKEMAVIYYQKAIDLDAGNQNAAGMLKEILHTK